jgi:hypothetical protein
LSFGPHAPKAPPVKCTFEKEDPENALEAIEILGIAVMVGDRYKKLLLEHWSVEAALKRRKFEDLSSDEIHDIRHWTRDGESVKWPRSFLEPA